MATEAPSPARRPASWACRKRFEEAMTISFERSGPVATISLDRPEKKNALNLAMRVELPKLFERVQDDVSIRAVVLTGAGLDFCAGADVSEMGVGGIADSMARVEI